MTEHSTAGDIAGRLLKLRTLEYVLLFAGCGGCTFGVLHSLHQQYGEALYQKRILLLNAGGYSQRLPTTSVLGKLFMALPIGEEGLLFGFLFDICTIHFMVFI